MRCSVGVASYLSPPLSADALIHDADELMYRAKEQGKDRIESAEFGDGGPRRTPGDRPRRPSFASGAPLAGPMRSTLGVADRV